MRLGFIGFGEAGFEMAAGFNGEGLKDILVYDVMKDDPVYGPLIQERVQASGVKMVSSPAKVLEAVDVVIVAVPGAKSLQAAQGLKPYLRASTVLVDVAASSPEIKQKIWEEVRNKGVFFVDCAMVGSVPLYKHKVPMLVSGSGCDQFMNLMVPFHMDIEKVSEIPGEATGIKLVRSIFMKGLPALIFEVLEAAAIMKVDHLVLKTLAKNMNASSFEEIFNRTVTSTAIHAERRAHEMENVIELLKGLHVEPTMAKATYERLTWLAAKNLRDKFAGKPPKEWREVVESWGKVTTSY